MLLDLAYWFGKEIEKEYLKILIGEINLLKILQ